MFYILINYGFMKLFKKKKKYGLDVKIKLSFFVGKGIFSF